MLRLKEKVISKLATFWGVNLQKLADYGRGISNEINPELNGELDTLIKIFKKSQNEELILFDIGANVGEYSELLSLHFPIAKIYAFEPNSNSFKILTERLGTQPNITLSNLALGAITGDIDIHYYAEDHQSSHASLYEKVLTDLHGNKSIDSQKTPITTLDRFSKKHGLKRIHWLKIDTEGYELEVLRGAFQMIKNGKVDHIQFEFNEMNIISKVFLKDFYDLLVGYRFYRISDKGLIPLGEYSSKNEIFRIQNILASRWTQ